MSEYSTLLGEAILRNRARVAEQSAQIETDLNSKIKSEFISNMSHELRTPLNTIIGFSKMLREHQTRPLNDEVITEYANLINDAAAHLLLIINEILDISKLQSGRYALDTQEVDLQALVGEIAGTFAKSAAEAKVDMRARYAPNLLPVRGDSEKLAQLFGNLIENAIKFTQPGGFVTIEVARLSDNGSAVVIANTGNGMSEKEIAVALMPFGQVDGTRTRWREGTGLGLPIAKALAELHGGQLTITGIKSKGTQVTVTLPSPELVSTLRECEMLSPNSFHPEQNRR